MTAEIGRVLGGRYRLVAPIGMGASAQVFLADDVRLRRRVAVKMLHDALADDAHVPRGNATEFRGVSLAWNAESEAAVDAIMDHAKSIGARIVKPPQKVFWGGYSGYFADPDGHLWEVAWNPGFALGADGALRLPD